MEKEKIYARELNPELYDYEWYDISNDEGNEVIINGCREYKDIDNKGYLGKIKKLANEYSDYDLEQYHDGLIKDYIEYYLPEKENGRAYHPKEIQLIAQALEKAYNSYGDDEFDELACVCLWVITGKRFKHKGLRGCCQGDYVEAYYPTHTNDEYIDWIEAWYFGTGIEIEIDESGEDIKDSSDIDGYTFYSAKWRLEDIKRDIKANAGYKEDDDNVEVILWRYDGQLAD